MAADATPAESSETCYPPNPPSSISTNMAVSNVESASSSNATLTAEGDEGTPMASEESNATLTAEGDEGTPMTSEESNAVTLDVIEEDQTEDERRGGPITAAAANAAVVMICQTQASCRQTTSEPKLSSGQTGMGADDADDDSSNSEWEPHGGWPDPDLSPRSENKRFHAHSLKRYYKNKAWAERETKARRAQGEDITDDIQLFNYEDRNGQPIRVHHDSTSIFYGCRLSTDPNDEGIIIPEGLVPFPQFPYPGGVREAAGESLVPELAEGIVGVSIDPNAEGIIINDSLVPFVKDGGDEAAESLVPELEEGIGDAPPIPTGIFVFHGVDHPSGAPDDDNPDKSGSPGLDDFNPSNDGGGQGKDMF
jgi:hypothetical protein